MQDEAESVTLKRLQTTRFAVWTVPATRVLGTVVIPHYLHSKPSLPDVERQRQVHSVRGTAGRARAVATKKKCTGRLLTCFVGGQQRPRGAMGSLDSTDASARGWKETLAELGEALAVRPSTSREIQSALLCDQYSK